MVLVVILLQRTDVSVLLLLRVLRVGIMYDSSDSYRNNDPDTPLEPPRPPFDLNHHLVVHLHIRVAEIHDL